MTQFNFTTNIEKRMPDTDKVYFVNRMTSDYAEQHPFDVDGFIESVYQEFKGTEFEEPREVLRKVWMDVMSEMNPRGNASLFPNKDGQKRAAAMKVWLCAGDYWRAGLRIGDTLPQIVPGHKITRLPDGGWIALFPKDEHLLTTTQPIEPRTEAECRTDTTDSTDTKVAEPQPEPKPEPRQLDLFAFERLQTQIVQHQSLHCAERFCNSESIPQSGPAHRQRRKRQQPTAAIAIEQPLNEPDITKNILKFIGIVVGLVIALIIIYKTGLLIPLALIGWATGGILK